MLPPAGRKGLQELWLAALGTVPLKWTLCSLKTPEHKQKPSLSLSPGAIPVPRGWQIAQLQLTERRVLWELKKMVALKAELWGRVWVKTYQGGVCEGLSFERAGPGSEGLWGEAREGLIERVSQREQRRGLKRLLSG